MSRFNICSKSNKNKSGFSLIELLIVIGIIAVLSLIAFPVLSRIIPGQRTANDAQRVEAYMQKARLRAATSSKPIRVVLNCSASPCWIEIQSAIYAGGTVTGWKADIGDHYTFSRDVKFMNSQASSSYDGANRAPSGVGYAIFMPDSRVYSDPRPFDIFIYYISSNNPKAGYQVSLSNDSGRVNSKRASLTTP
ncbi:MAG: prepilin-type N-terminal cleavage/methylation domain-containing protein [Deltaproteobacteria bacterium]|jgi:prepilin-type N-terminal cleavage/methylation domain-containing protein|nr:prepilin-type N-terminal cleavage/methylation domain-containing protein [Deltaproteobacteria bacterium]